MLPLRARLVLALAAVAGCLALASPTVHAQSAPPLVPTARGIDVGRLYQAADDLGAATAAAGLVADDVALAARALVVTTLASRRMSPTAIAEIADHVVDRVLAASPEAAPLEVGTLRLSRSAARQVLGSRLGRDRLAVLGRLRGAVPAQASTLSDDDLLALLPALASAAEPRPIPGTALAPLSRALEIGSDQ